MSDIAVRRDGAEVMEAVITKGDLARLTPQEKTKYYAEVCRSVGLNPFTRPFEYISLSGKLTLYARREATDQLRRLNGISLEVISREVIGDILTVHVRAKDKTGRIDEDFGSVSIKGLAGEALANANMKAITKGKRRVTLSISGLGFLDETEVEDVPAFERSAPADTRAQLDSFAVDADALEHDGREAATGGMDALRAWFRGLTQTQRDAIGGLIGNQDEPGPLLLLAQDAEATEPPAGIPPAAAPRPAAAAAPAGETHDAETGEVSYIRDEPDPAWLAEFNSLAPRPADLGSDELDWHTYVQAVVYLIGKASPADLAGVEISRNPHMLRLRSEDTDRYRQVIKAIAKRARGTPQ